MLLISYISAPVLLLMSVNIFFSRTDSVASPSGDREDRNPILRCPADRRLSGQHAGVVISIGENHNDLLAGLPGDLSRYISERIEQRCISPCMQSQNRQLCGCLILGKLLLLNQGFRKRVDGDRIFRPQVINESNDGILKARECLFHTSRGV